MTLLSVGIVVAGAYAYLLLLVVTYRILTRRYGWEDASAPGPSAFASLVWPAALALISIYEIARRIVRDCEATS